jgi:hypothetical protein
MEGRSEGRGQGWERWKMWWKEGRRQKGESDDDEQEEKVSDPFYDNCGLAVFGWWIMLQTVSHGHRHTY